MGLVGAGCGDWRSSSAAAACSTLCRLPTSLAPLPAYHLLSPALQTLLTKQEWVTKPDMPAGLTKPGLLELAAAAVEARRQIAGGAGASVDAGSAATAAKGSPNGSAELVAESK